MTLPYTKIGFVLVSGAPGVLVDGVLREVAPEPEEPVPRCAVAVATSKAITIINRVLGPPETSAIAASIRKSKNFKLKKPISAELETRE